jgi:acyl-coenzyme A thioesterase PaaI-like protein
MINLRRATETLSQVIAGPIADALPSGVKNTFLLRSFGFLKIPMLFFVSPSVQELSEQRCVVRVPLNRRTRNHHKSMYFAALAAGADCAGGLIAMRMIQDTGNRVSLIFKDFHAEFLKRAEGDVLFSCEQGDEIRACVQKALDSTERQHVSVLVMATVPSKSGDEPVAKFTLTVSLKRRAGK